MLEKIGDKDIIVRNYLDNFNVKEYIQEVLVPKAFPQIPMNKLNVGFTGIVSDYIGQLIEDIQGEASLMINEAFVSKAVLPSSINAEAAVYDLGYRYATPSTCSFAIEIRIENIIDNATPVPNTSTYRYILDKFTKVVLGNNVYELDYDVYIDYTFINGKRVYKIYYNMDEPNSISDVTNKYIKHQVSLTGWLVLFMDLKEFTRTTDTVSITDNIITTNSEIEISWIKQIAGIDLIYISPQGQRMTMKLKKEYTPQDVDPFAWYRFIDDNKIALSFSSSNGYWMPEFNSKIEYTVYTTLGKGGEFVSYDRNTDVPVKKSGERYPYNADSEIVALCYSGSTGATDRGNMEQLRSEIVAAKNTVNVLSTENDLAVWFDTYGKVYGTISKFFKRRDDPSGRLYSQFIAIKDGTYIYPTNTLGISVDESECDHDNGEEFIIQAGHLWQYDGDDRNNAVMIHTDSGTARITDESLPEIGDDLPFMFVNPFVIKIHQDPTTSIMYNYLINDTSWPEDVPIDSNCFYQFQLATFSIERNIDLKYHIELVCVPVITTDTSIKYIEEIGGDLTNNNLRLILVTYANSRETGYIEMVPIEKRESGAYVFATDIFVTDELTSDMLLAVDEVETPDITKLAVDGILPASIFMNSQETSFHFITLMKDADSTSTLFNDPRYVGYTMTNRFRNNSRDLNLYKAMGMMRSTVDISQNPTKIKMTLIPFLKYDIPLDNKKMAYFSQAFQDQYKNIEPIRSRLEGNTFLDVKLYNTYGRSMNYCIGPSDEEKLLDNVYVNVNMAVSVYDRSMYTQTVNEVMNEIMTRFDALNTNEDANLYVSDIIHDIIQNIPNVRYVRFLGFNGEDANFQYIYVKNTDVSQLNMEELKVYVPEIIRADETSIDIQEET